ncbi:MAG: 1,2-phenylacetyl-CoA epoxidase subunit PaaC [Bacteroidota bacterium]
MNQPINRSTNQLIDYSLHLADNALILAQRNAEWTGHGPVLEQDIAISNIALDLVGQARNFYQYTAQLINNTTGQNIEVSNGQSATEDSLAFLRNADDFKNCLLVELEKGDWARTVLRQFLFSNYQFFLYRQLQQLNDATLAAIAAKAFKEVSYHLRWSAEWVVRLGDGTAESNRRLGVALQYLWSYTGELTTHAVYESVLAGENSAVDLSTLKQSWMDKTKEVLVKACLQIPLEKWMQSGGKEGRHTEHLGHLLAELQYLQRAYPGNTW